MERTQGNKVKFWISLVVLLCVSIFTHFYRIDHTFTFHNDEARDVLIVKKMIDTGKPVLLGPQTSVGNMYLGPLYYYLMLPPLLISNMNPVGPAIMVGIFGVATTLLLFLYAYRKYGLNSGIMAGMVYALTPIMINYSRASWNPNIVPFFATLLLFIFDSKNKLSWLCLGLCAGVIFQLHYVALSAVALVLMAKLWGEKKWFLGLILVFMGFLITSMPFWLFEIRHGFVNSGAFLTYLKDGDGKGAIDSTYISRLYANSTLVFKGIIASSSIMLTQVNPLIILLAGVLFLFALPLISGGWFLWYLILGTLFFVSLLKSTINVHYISHLFPVIAMGFATLISSSKLYIKYLALLLVSYLFIWSIPTLIYNLHTIDSSQTKRAQGVADYIVREANGRKYNIFGTQGTFTTSVEYYLSLSNNHPSIDVAGIAFDICDDKSCPLDDETNTLIFATGPTHPAISEYLGHPTINEFAIPRKIINNERVVYSTWVATMTLDH